jgi:hypothetical protein
VELTQVWGARRAQFVTGRCGPRPPGRASRDRCDEPPQRCLQLNQLHSPLAPPWPSCTCTLSPARRSTTPPRFGNATYLMIVGRKHRIRGQYTPSQIDKRNTRYPSTSAPNDSMQKVTARFWKASNPESASMCRSPHRHVFVNFVVNGIDRTK